MRGKVAFLLLAGLLLAAGPALAKDHLIVGFEDALKTMDCHQTDQRVGIQVGYLIWDPLLERDPHDGTLKPHLVTSWKALNETTWEFKLRKDVKFHNGNPLNAEAVRFTIEDRILDPKQKSPNVAGWKWVKKVEVVDDYTFRVITQNPYPLVLERFNTLFVFDPKWTKEMEAKNGPRYLSRHAMGSGPFKFVEFQDGIKIEMVKNENYWKKGWPKFDKLTIRFIPERSTRLAELIAGGIDVAHAILPDQIPTVLKDPKLKLIEVPILRVNFWQFDGDLKARGTPPALKDVRVRQAIIHAIDREAIIKNVLGGHADLVNVPCNPRQFGCEYPFKGYEYNPEKAKALLKEAGAEKGFKINLWTYTAITKQANEAAAGYLAKVGIEAVIKDYVGRVGEMAKVAAAGKTDGILNMTWGSYNIFDADAIIPAFFMPPESVYCYNNDKDVIGWLRAARGMVDPAKRKDLYAKAVKRICEKAYWMPFFTQRDLHGANKHVDYILGLDQVPRYQYASWK